MKNLHNSRRYQSLVRTIAWSNHLVTSRRRAIIVLAIIAIAYTSISGQVVLSRGSNLEEVIKPGISHTYTLRLAQGESANVVVHQEGVDVVVELYAPTGKLIDSIDSPNGRTGDEPVEVIASESGAYRITVRPYDSNEPEGKFRLEVLSLRDKAETNKLLQQRAAIRQEATNWLRERSISSSTIAGFGPATKPLRTVVASSAVIGIGEATHGSREFGDLRMSLTKWLVENYGFRAIAIEGSESGLKLLEPYVAGKTPLTRPMEEFLNTGWIGRRIRREIVEWVRKWNLTHAKDPVQIVGVDAGDNKDARSILGTFLGKAYGSDVSAKWIPIEKELAAADEQTLVFGDSGISPSIRSSILELLATLEMDKYYLSRKFSVAEVDAAIDAAQTLAEFADFNAGARIPNHSRDWYMAMRVLRVRASGRVVYWAHNAHVAHPSNTSRTTGAILKSVLGCDYKALAVAFDEGSFIAQLPNDLEDRLVTTTLQAAPDETVEGVVRPIGTNVFAAWPCNAAGNIDQDGSLPGWLRQPRLMHWVGGIYNLSSMPSTNFRTFSLISDFDGLVYIRRVKAEEIPMDRPLVPGRKR